MTLFSIIIPCYNQAHFLTDCLNSLLEQDFKDWEAIVVNDGSPDHTSEVARQFIKKDSRIKLVEKINGGLSSARNKGIEKAVGDFFIFLDADDLIINNCLNEYEKIILQNIEFIQSDYSCFKKNKKDILFTRSNIPKYNNFFKSIMHANVGPVNGFVVSRNIINKVGCFNEQLTSCEDWDFWIRCGKSGFEPFVVNKIFATYRFVPGSMGKNSLRMLEQGLKVINKHHLEIDATNINLEALKINVPYYNSCIEYLMATVGIALYNNQQEHLNVIKRDYLEKLSVQISIGACDKISNYQTFRNLSIFHYLLFYIKNEKTYNKFFIYLVNKKLINKSEYSYVKKIFPTPIRKVYNRIIKKIKF